MWPDLYFLRASDFTEAVYVNASLISRGTLLPFGGEFVTHWEYLTRKVVESTAVSTWIPVEDPDRDGRPLWYIPESKEPLVSPLHLLVGVARNKGAKELNLKIVWSVFAAEDFLRRRDYSTALCGH